MVGQLFVMCLAYFTLIELVDIKIGHFTIFSIPLKLLGSWDLHDHSEVNKIDSMPKLPLTR